MYYSENEYEQLFCELYDNYLVTKPIYKYISDDSSITIISKKNILDLFKIDLLNHRKARLAIYYHLHLQPSELDYMTYFDFEDLVFDLGDMLKEKAEAEKKAYNDQKESSGANQAKYNKSIPKISQPKIPSMKNFRK